MERICRLVYNNVPKDIIRELHTNLREEFGKDLEIFLVHVDSSDIYKPECLVLAPKYILGDVFNFNEEQKKFKQFISSKTGIEENYDYRRMEFYPDNKNCIPGNIIEDIDIIHEKFNHEIKKKIIDTYMNGGKCNIYRSNTYISSPHYPYNYITKFYIETENFYAISIDYYDDDGDNDKTHSEMGTILDEETRNRIRLENGICEDELLYECPIYVTRDIKLKTFVYV